MFWYRMRLWQKLKSTWEQPVGEAWKGFMAMAGEDLKESDDNGVWGWK